MIVMNRGDFINCLKKGDVIVLGTCTGCAGMLHNQGTTNGMYIRGNEKETGERSAENQRESRILDSGRSCSWR